MTFLLFRLRDLYQIEWRQSVIYTFQRRKKKTTPLFKQHVPKVINQENFHKVCLTGSNALLLHNQSIRAARWNARLIVFQISRISISHCCIPLLHPTRLKLSEFIRPDLPSQGPLFKLFKGVSFSFSTYLGREGELQAVRVIRCHDYKVSQHHPFYWICARWFVTPAVKKRAKSPMFTERAYR